MCISTKRYAHLNLLLSSFGKNITIGLKFYYGGFELTHETALTANASTGGQLCSKYATNALARSDNQICLLVSFAVSMPQTLTAR